MPSRSVRGAKRRGSNGSSANCLTPCRMRRSVARSSRSRTFSALCRDRERQAPPHQVLGHPRRSHRGGLEARPARVVILDLRRTG